MHRTIHGADHAALLDDKQYAQESSNAIDEVVAAARLHAELTR